MNLNIYGSLVTSVHLQSHDLELQALVKAVGTLSKLSLLIKRAIMCEFTFLLCFITVSEHYYRLSCDTRPRNAQSMLVARWRRVAPSAAVHQRG